MDNETNREKFLEKKLNNTEEEIYIRVESIKNEIEEAGMRLKERLREMKQELKMKCKTPI